ncbi:MAG: TolC family protein, partial [Sideroxyarcus sp.]|nr:TolC family protein [Sideroxyarcus sp.]
IAESRLASSRANLAAAQGDLSVSREAYKLATGNYPGKLAALPKAPKTAKSLDEARAVALRTHPALRRAQHLVTVADLNVARAEAAMKPTLTMNADISMLERNPNSDLLNESIGLTFNQRIYAGGRSSALFRRAMASREADRSALHQSARQLEQLVGNAWSNLEVSAASISATDLQIVAARTAFEGLREEAKLGARTTLDVLNAEQDLLDAQSARLSAVATRYVGVYSLLQQMGLLTVDHLQLGIPEYDVTSYYNAVKDAPSTSSQGKSLDRVLKAIGGN